MEGSGGSADEALARAQLARELNENAVREMALAVRIAELEGNRWSAFSIVELEWISTVSSPAAVEGSAGDGLPYQANAELERRARDSAALESDVD